MSETPRLSIVTTSYNQAPFLEQTLRSISEQGLPDLQHIVIDGASTDGSVDILRRFGGSLAYWVSERDRGQVHALNKGLERATGELFAFINSDDLLLPGALSAVVERFERDPSLEWLCGDVVMFGEGHPTELIEARVPKDAAHCLAWAYKAPQPGHFWRRRLLVDGFDERWQYDFDHDLYVRLLLQGHRCEHIPLPVAAYRLHPASKTVAEAARMDGEFDRVAEVYEPQLGFHGRRWSKATRYLRQSWAAAEIGEKRRARALVLRAALLHPEGVFRRSFWGCARRLFH